MGSIGAPEILVIFVVALLVLGPERLPGAMRRAGRVLGELRRIGAGFQAELREAASIADPMNPSATAPTTTTTTPTSPTPTPGAPPGPSSAVDHLVAPPPTARPDAPSE